MVVFFAQKQIEDVMRRQETDQFMELFDIKSEMKNLEIAQGKIENAIQIMDYAPKIEIKLELDKKRKINRRKLTSNDDADELFQQEMLEYNNRDPNAGKKPEEIEWEKE